MFEMEPMNEIKIGNQEHVSLRQIVKSVSEDEPTIWFAQVSHKEELRNVACCSG